MNVKGADLLESLMTQRSDPGAAEAEPESRPTVREMPVEGKIAVAILRIQVFLGLLCWTGLGVESVTGLFEAEDPAKQLAALTSEPLFARAALMLLLAWLVGGTILRAVIAGAIAARKRWARTTLIALQYLEMGAAATAWLLLAITTGDGKLVGAVVSSSMVGVVTAVALVMLVGTRDMAAWCDRQGARPLGRADAP
ncbi:hypothetical protein GCM10027447_04030 [Glycomyces halotolerans]